MAEGGVGLAGPLAGITILDLSTLLPGPYATWLLRRLGARVIKVERTGRGDPMRSVYPTTFTLLNADKESVAIDLKKPAGRGLVLELARQAEVFVEGFRPGVAERLGVGYEQVRSVRPDVVYCSLSAYGATGPWSGQPAHDVNILALTGVLSVSGAPEGGPSWPGGLQWADLASALFAALEIVATLLGRRRGDTAAAGHAAERGDEGGSDGLAPASHLDLSMLDAVLQLALPRLSEYLGAGRPDRRAFLTRAGYGAFEAGDGRWLSLACIEDPFWERLRDLLQLDEPWVNAQASDAKAAADGEASAADAARAADGVAGADAAPARGTRGAGWSLRNLYATSVNRQIAQRLHTRGRDEWLAVMAERDIPAAPVYSLDEVAAHPLLRNRSLPAPLSATGATPCEAALRATGPQRPLLGEHTLEVLGVLRQPEELRALAEAGVIATAEAGAGGGAGTAVGEASGRT